MAFKFPAPPGFTAPISKDSPPVTPDLCTTAPDIEVETIEIVEDSADSQHDASTEFNITGREITKLQQEWKPSSEQLEKSPPNKALPKVDWKQLGGEEVAERVGSEPQHDRQVETTPEVPDGVEYPANGVQDKKRRGGRRSNNTMVIAGTGIRIHPRDKALVEAYIATGFNGGIAYQTISPDVCERTALAQASLILKRPEVQEFLAYRMEQLVTETGLDVRQARILKEFERLAYSGITDVIGWDIEGNITVIASDGLSEDVLNSIKKVKVNSTTIGGDITKSTIEIEMHDKKSALDSLAKIHGMIIDKKELSGPNGGPITLAAAIAEIEDGNTGPAGI